MEPVTSVNPMLAAVTSGLTTVIEWMGTVVTALVGESGALNALLPLLAIGVSISALMLGFVRHVGCQEKQPSVCNA